MNRELANSRLRVIMYSLIMWQAVATAPSVSNAIPLADFTGHSENLSSVVNFAVLPPGDAFTHTLTPYFQGANGSNSGLNPHHFTYLYQISNRLGPPSAFHS
jgi:hypothetical protein